MTLDWDDLEKVPMPRFTFLFRLDPELRQEALEGLRAALPAAVVVTPKTNTAVAVEWPESGPAADLAALRRDFGDSWEVHPSVQAEIGPPKLNLRLHVSRSKRAGREPGSL